MSGYSVRNPDMSLTVLTDNGDGTGTLEQFDPDGSLVSSQALTLPIPEPEPPEPIDPVVVEGFATGILEAQSLQEMRDAAQALLDALGGA